MSVPREPDSFEFADYLGVLRRRWWLVVILGCVGLLVGVAYLELAPKAYTATASVNVIPTGASQSQQGAVAGGRTTGVINLDTEAQIVQSTTIAVIAAHTLHSSVAPSQLLARVSVTVPPNSSVLQIGCTANSAQQAAACANAFGAAYLQNRSANAANTISAQLNSVRTQQNTLEKQAAQLTTQTNTLPSNSAQRGSAETQLNTVTNELKSLANQEVSLSGEAASSSGGSIITPATPPATPSSPKKLLALPSGLLAGLLLGLIVAFTRDRSDQRISSTRGLTRSGLPVLLVLPRKSLGADPMVSVRSPAGLEFTELARITAAALGQDSHMLLVAGVSPGNDCDVVAANLAAMLARMRTDAILVCPAGQRTPEFLGLTGTRRLDSATAAELAAGRASLAEFTTRPAGFAGLRVLVLDSDLSDLQYEHARQLALRLRGSAQYVVIEAPAHAAGADSFALAEFCDTALLTVEMSRTKRPQLDDRIRRLDRLGLQILGITALPRLRLRLPVPDSRDPEAAQPLSASDPQRAQAAAERGVAANGAPGFLRVGQPARESAAEQDEEATLVMSRQTSAEIADEPHGD